METSNQTQAQCSVTSNNIFMACYHCLIHHPIINKAVPHSSKIRIIIPPNNSKIKTNENYRHRRTHPNSKCKETSSSKTLVLSRQVTQHKVHYRRHLPNIKITKCIQLDKAN